MNLNYTENWDWNYEDALKWMQYASQRCLTEEEMSFGVGMHSKNLVTLGRHANRGDIINPSALENLQVDIFQTDRGGGATLHGPGQIVLYPVISLKKLKLSVPMATHILEESIIACLSDFGIQSNRVTSKPGIYVGESKIGSVGFRVSRDVLTHGISLNVNNDLTLFSHIATCKKVNAAITSMAALVGEKTDIRSVGRLLAKTTISNLGLDLTLAPKSL